VREPRELPATAMAFDPGVVSMIPEPTSVGVPLSPLVAEKVSVLPLLDVMDVMP